MSTIEVRNLSKQYHRDHSLFYALKNISFSAQQGEVLGIIGANGAGKTTLLCALLGSVHATSGQIRLNGPVGAMISLGVGFCEDLTGRENLLLSSQLLNIPHINIRAVGEFSECSKQLDVPLKRYSNGQKVRLEFALITQLRTPILLLDEDLSWADAAFRAKARSWIAQEGKKNRTILLASHLEENMRECCTRILWLHKGQIAETGNPETVIDHYLQYSQQERSAWTSPL